jgi:hypothetical protein
MHLGQLTWAVLPTQPPPPWPANTAASVNMAILAAMFLLSQAHWFLRAHTLWGPEGANDQFPFLQLWLIRGWFWDRDRKLGHFWNLTFFVGFHMWERWTLSPLWGSTVLVSHALDELASSILLDCKPSKCIWQQSWALQLISMQTDPFLYSPITWF